MFVLKQDEGALLGGAGLGDKIGVADNGGGSVWVGIGIFKEADGKFLLEDALGGLAHTSFGDFSCADGSGDELRLFRVADLIDAGI
jgi:hypothetical protein